MSGTPAPADCCGPIGKRSDIEKYKKGGQNFLDGQYLCVDDGLYYRKMKPEYQKPKIRPPKFK